MLRRTMLCAGSLDRRREGKQCFQAVVANVYGEGSTFGDVRHLSDGRRAEWPELGTYEQAQRLMGAVPSRQDPGFCDVLFPRYYQAIHDLNTGDVSRIAGMFS